MRLPPENTIVYDTIGGIMSCVMENSPKLVPCVVQVPLVDNDGNEFEPRKLVTIFSWFDRQFGGYTNLGQMEGSWHGQVEPSIRIEVAVAENRIAQFRDVVCAIGKLLEQEAMYFDAPPPSVEIIPMSEYSKTGGKEGNVNQGNESSSEGGS